MPTYWVGIDEAGYGPNLGPMVMTAVVAESPDDRPPDLWADLPGRVRRAGGEARSLWVDDSKAVYRGGQGRDRLEAACLATVVAAGAAPPRTFAGLLEALGAGTLESVELSPWLDDGAPPFPSSKSFPLALDVLDDPPFEGAPWRIVTARSVVTGPSAFNAGLDVHGSKAGVHFGAFAELLRHAGGLAPPGATTHVRSDKHGGRHFYLGPLMEAFPGAWVDRGEEGPALSRYVIRRDGARLELSLQPRADADDGLVALASMVSKAVRETWMDAWNAHWLGRVPGLKPTAGYPVDALRFRKAIEPLCDARGLVPDQWWRRK